ncbi:MAG TPA: type VI secretion system protein TssA [Burkholderiales bacterium]|jgi:type VI secretion system protein ImpA
MDAGLDALLAPISDEAPAGPDLSYDAEFLELEHAAKGKPEQQFGDTLIAAEEPDWQDVRRRAQALLARSKDLRVALLLTRALVHLENAEGLAAGLGLVNQMLSRYWDTLHPGLDQDDSNDPTMRLNALAPLADGTTMLRDIRNAWLVSSTQHGRVAFRDVLVAAGKLPPGTGAEPNQAQIEGTLRAIAAENPDPLQAALASADLVQSLEALLSEKGVITQAPDLRPLSDLLHAVVPVCKSVLAPDAHSAQAAYGPGEMRAHAPGALTSRDDVIRALENVCRFIEQSEPSNPAPLLIRRAQRLIGRKFVDIIEDLAPESLAQIQKLAGLEQSK